MTRFLKDVRTRHTLGVDVISRITRTCFRLITLSGRLGVIHRALCTHGRKMHLTGLHFRKKLASRASCRRTRIRCTHATALIPRLREGVSLGRGSVTFLTNRCPRRVRHSVLPRRMGLPRALPMNLPSALLRHHPSMHRTRRGLVTTGTDMNVTCAGVFPQLDLATRCNMRDRRFSSFFGSPVRCVDNGLLAPLFTVKGCETALGTGGTTCRRRYCDCRGSILATFGRTHGTVISFGGVGSVCRSHLRLRHSSGTAVRLTRLRCVGKMVNCLSMLSTRHDCFSTRVKLDGTVESGRVALMGLCGTLKNK